MKRERHRVKMTPASLKNHADQSMETLDEKDADSLLLLGQVRVNTAFLIVLRCIHCDSIEIYY